MTTVRRHSLKGLFGINTLAYFAYFAKVSMTEKRQDLKGFVRTNSLAYFVRTSVTTIEDIPINDFPELTL